MRGRDACVHAWEMFAAGSGADYTFLSTTCQQSLSPLSRNGHFNVVRDSADSPARIANMFNRLKSIFATKSSPPVSSPLVDESSTHKKQGDEHLKFDRLDDAAACYRRALAIDPRHVDACVGLGFVLSEQKQYGEAEQYLRTALSIDPGIADVHYILGTMANNQNDRAGAIDHFARALEIKPDLEFACRDMVAALSQSGRIAEAKEVLERALSVNRESGEFPFNLGNLFTDERAYDHAIACYQRALSLEPGSAAMHKALANALNERGQSDQAIASYQKALWFAPDFFDAHVGLGGVLQAQGKLDPAIACYERAVALEPKSAVALQYLGNALLAKGATQEAVACYEQVMRLDPTHAVQHLIAALSGGESERAPSDYVEKLFDDYAEKFDSHLVKALRYGVPEQLVNLLRPYADAGGQKWDILDLGCGTGLSGAALAPVARQIVGVDLSAKMLDKARERNLYQRLEQLDLLTMMQAEAAASYDVVFATDVFVYVGKLDELVHQVQRLLRPGGLFAFSVESLDALTDDATQRSGPARLQAQRHGALRAFDRVPGPNGSGRRLRRCEHD